MVENTFTDEGLAAHGREFPQDLLKQFTLQAHASREYLGGLNQADQTRVERLLGAALSDSRSTGGEPAVSITFKGDRVCVAGAMKDSSFIADTVELAIQKLGIDNPEHATAELSLGDDEKMGLFYVEFTGTESLAADFAKKLSDSLSTLKVAADDFHPAEGPEHNKYFAALDGLREKINQNKAGYEGMRFPPEEVAGFLNWLKGHFIFMGHTRMEVGSEGSLNPSSTPNSGLYRMKGASSEALLTEAQIDAHTIRNQHHPVWISTLGIDSLIQRDDRLINISLQERGKDGEVTAVHSVVGLFSHDGQKYTTSKIPLIRERYRELKSQVPDNECSQKYLERLIDGMPVELALRLGTTAIRDFYNAASNAHGRDPIHVHMAPDAAARGIAGLVVLPTKRCSPETLEGLSRYFEQSFGAAEGSCRVSVDTSQPRYARAYFYMPADSGKTPEVSNETLRKDVVQLVRSWSEHLEHKIKGEAEKSSFEESGETLAARYRNAFPKSVQELDSVALALSDVKRIESMKGGDNVRVSIDCPDRNCEKDITISIYSKRGKVGVSDIVPILEKAGFKVEEDRQFTVNPKGADGVHVARIQVTPRAGVKLDFETFADVVGPGLEAVIKKQADNDALNALMASAKLNTQQIGVLRAAGLAVSRFGVANESRVQMALAENPVLAKLAYEMLNTKFNWDLSIYNEQREQKLAPLRAEYARQLRSVKSPPDAHKVLSALHKVLNATERAVIDGDTIVLKTYPQKIDFLTGEQPLVATFISSPRFRCVHLRHGLVARGGFRWSDKPDEFYVEVKKLASTQRKKNGPLVVDGAKGAFVPAAGVKGEDAYRESARALLSITDNRVGGNIIPPARVVRWDGNDPYLVMAADKGTGTFSWIANQEAVKADFWGPGNKGFWLGHVFASGGPHGFSHFDTGVTARGALIVSNFQLLKAGIDPKATQDVLLIGDPYGDVSGNAITRRENWNIVAAWGWPNIYIDPNPQNPEAHLAERKRLLTAGPANGTWDKYERSLLSPGGGIYRVDDPAIPVTPEARARFGIPANIETLPGDEYIQYLQRSDSMPLRYGGGIGTHVKASSQEAGATQDTPNEGKLVNGAQIGAKVAIEGGNNGWTQPARLEAWKHGVRMYVDAIDNVGGVKTSNEEVLWGLTVMEKVLRTGEISEQEYHDLMKTLQPDALHNVFRLVHDQCTALTLDEIESPKTARFFDLMLKRLEEDRILSRDENYLPSSEELVARAGTAHPGLFGPELAECISGSKRWVKSVLLRNGNPTLSDGGVDQLFVESFPERLLDQGKDGITTFPLIKEQTATQLSNALIDSLGTTFLFQLAAKHGPAQPEKPIHAATAAELTLEVRHLRNEVRQKLWGDLEDSPTMEGYQHYISAMQDIRKAHQSLTTWMLSNYSKPEDLSKLQQTYQSVWDQAAENPLAVVPENQREEVQRKITAYVSAGLDQAAANKLALAGSISSVFEMAKHVAGEGEPLAQVANRYWPIVRETGVGRVLELTTSLNTNEPNRDNAMGDDLRYIRKAVARIATSMRDQNPADLGSTLASKPEYSNLSGAIDTFGRMVVAAQHDDRLVADALLALHTVRERVEDVAKALARKGLPN